MNRMKGTATLLIIALAGGAVFLAYSGALPAHWFAGTVQTENQGNVDNGACEALRVHGDPAEKADLVLIGKDYTSRDVMLRDFAYFMDFDGDNRGLFAIPPFDEYKEAFNIWTLNAGTAIGDYGDSRTGRGLIKDARDWFSKCPHADYQVVLAKGGMGRGAFTLRGHRMFVKDVHRKVQLGQGAAGFLHEWGHAFAQLKDEYYRDGGRDAPGRPNCADTREQAEAWWGDLAAERDDVGFYQGCAYNAGNWRPHKASIMGNGGRHSYGPVNERRIRTVLEQYR